MSRIASKRDIYLGTTPMLRRYFYPDPGDGSGDGNGDGNSGDKKIELTEVEFRKKLDDEAAKVKAVTERKMQKEIDTLKADLQATKDSIETAADEAKGEYKVLFERQKAENADLKKQLSELTGSLKTRIESQHKLIDTKIESWPDEIKAMDPGPESDVDSRAAWVEKAEVAANKILGKGGAPAGEHHRPTDRRTDSAGADTVTEALKRANSGRPKLA